MSGQDNGRDVMAAVRAVRDKANGGGEVINDGVGVATTTTGMPRFVDGKYVRGE